MARRKKLEEINEKIKEQHPDPFTPDPPPSSAGSAAHRHRARIRSEEQDLNGPRYSKAALEIIVGSSEPITLPSTEWPAKNLQQGAYGGKEGDKVDATLLRTPEELASEGFARIIWDGM